MNRISILHNLGVASGLIAGLALLASSAGCSRPSAAETVNADGKEAPPALRITAAQPIRKTLRLETVQPGWIEPFEETPLFAKITGYVEKVHVDIGDPVEKNDVLVTLRVPEMVEELNQKDALVKQARAEVQQAAAAVDAARAAIKTAQSRVTEANAGLVRADGDYERWMDEHDRISELAKRGSVSQKLVSETLNQLRSAEAARLEAEARIKSFEAARDEALANLEKAKADERAAAARVNVAEADRARMKALLEYAEFKAPYKGVVTRRNVDTGHFVQPPGGNAKPLLVVASTETMRIFVDVPEREAGWVTAGKDLASVRIQALDGREFTDQKITRTSWSLSPTNRALRTEIDVTDASGLLRPGMYATVTIVLEERQDALTLPATAIVRDGRQTFCYCVEEGKVVRKPVELGLRVAGDIQILSGLGAEETVVTAPTDSLKVGEVVEVLMANEK